MGNPASKNEHEVHVLESEAQEGSLPSTPILTPRTRVMDLDPRSPSANIVRTPIEVILTPNRKPFCMTENTSSDILDDPRSPTTDFTRTPIVIYNKQDPSLPTKLHNKNLDNVRKTITSYSPTSLNPKNTPKLLESSPISPKVSNIKRRSFAGLLETNLDFVETDLDSVINQCKIPEEKLLTNKIEEINLNKSAQDAKQVETADEALNTEQVETEDAVTNEAPNTELEAEPDINVLQGVKEFNKKLANLIYEDDEVVSPAIKTVVLSEGSRTPLGERNSNTDGNRKKSLPKLRVSDHPKKFNKEMSKIPVFKDKRTKGKFRQHQCENTPPSNMNDFTLAKSKGQQWDQNNTIII